MKLTQTNYRYNLGIELLRLLMAFWVILYHSFKTKNYQLNNIIQAKFHVPTFMFISIFFFQKILYNRNINKIRERFIRLLIPYIIWPSITFIFNNLIFKIFDFNRFNRELALIELIYQILFGNKFHGVLWFINILIILIFFFSINMLIFKKHYYFIFIIIAIINIIFNYSYYNLKLIIYTYRWSFLGRILGMFPIAVVALFFSSINIIAKLKLFRTKIVLFSFIIIYLLIKYYKNLLIIQGYTYQDIIYIIGASQFFFCFALLPFEYIKKKRGIIIFLRNISRYTGGIYYIHFNFVRNYAKKMNLIKENSIMDCLIIYLISYFICFIGIKIFGKTKFKLYNIILSF